jgi:hypothetical protein
MNLSDVKVVGQPLVLAQAREVDELESRLWITFPAGYREYVTQLGEGILGGTFVRVYPPWRLEKELSEWRTRIDKYWFWDAGKELLPKARALECVVLADTMQGDELVFHPRYPDRLFVLPRGGQKIFAVGEDLFSAVDWMCGSGKLTRRFKERNFEPFDSRLEVAKEKSVSDPPGESLDDIVKLGKQWAKRHRARKILFDDLPIGKGKATFVYEAIVIDANEGFGLDSEEEGYLAVFRVDKPNGEVRIHNCQMTDNSSGGTDGDLVKRELPDD